MVTLARIESIKSVGVGDFYDLHVPNEEHYFAEGAIHHNSSKTYGTAAWLDLDWASAPDKTLSFVASTSLGGSEDRIWGTVAKLFRRMAFPIGYLIDHRKIIVFEDPSKADERDYTCAIKALAFPTGDEGRKAVETTRGRKAERVRCAVDELAEMEPYVNKVSINLRANDDCVYVGIANPNQGDNPHRELCEPADPRGYDSISVNDRKWKTRTGTAIFLHGEDSPNFEAPENEPPPFPYLLTRRKKADILKDCHGNANSLEYWRNVIGFWPTDSIETSVISRSVISQADISFEPAWTSAEKKRIAFLDCAWTSGGDRNEVSYGFIARLRSSGKKVLMYQGTRGFSVDAGSVFEENLAEQVIPTLEQYGVSPSGFGADVSGDGGRVLSAFIRTWQKTAGLSASSIVPVTYSGTPSDRVVSSEDKRKGSDVYDRKITEDWFRFYHAVVNRCFFGLDLQTHKTVVDELCARQYGFKGKKMAVETKKEMKKRIGKSPDCFVAGTMIMTPSGEVAIENIKVGDIVVTPLGDTPVVFIHCRKSDDIFKVTTPDGRTLEGRGDHRVFTFEKGWVKLRDISSLHTMESAADEWKWNILKNLFTRDEATTFKAQVDTIRTGRRLSRRDFFIESSGLSTMALFLTAIKSITKMAIGRTMRLGIWRLLRNERTEERTCSQECPIQSSGKKPWMVKRRLSSLLCHGTEVQKESRGTKRTGSGHVLTWLKSLLHALSAVRYLIPIGRGSVPPSASTECAEGKEEEVFDLTLLRHNAYYANGVLVENCADSLIGLFIMAEKLGVEIIADDKVVDRREVASSRREEVVFGSYSGSKDLDGF